MWLSHIVCLQDDVNSTGVSVCRHGFVAHLLNSFTGERHAYAILFVSLILEQGIPLQFLWYDINCRWANSFWKWLETQPADIQRLARDMQCPLPPWHLFAHRWVHSNILAPPCPWLPVIWAAAPLHARDGARAPLTRGSHAACNARGVTEPF